MQLSVLFASVCFMSNGMLLFLQSSSTSCKKDCPTVFFNVSGRNPYSSTGSKGCICCSRIYSIRVKQCLFFSVQSIMSVLLWYFCRIYTLQPDSTHWTTGDFNCGFWCENMSEYFFTLLEENSMEINLYCHFQWFWK